MELLSNLGLHSSCIAMLLVMAFLSFGQKLISSPEQEEEKATEADAPELQLTEPAMSHK